MKSFKNLTSKILPVKSLTRHLLLSLSKHRLSSVARHRLPSAARYQLLSVVRHRLLSVAEVTLLAIPLIFLGCSTPDEATTAENTHNAALSVDVEPVPQSDKTSHSYFMNEAVSAAINGMNANEGGPFGCVVVKNGKIVGRGNNKVTSTNDPTAHAEVTAIRDACKNLNSFQLDSCIIYTSCEPCPMCLGAIYWARPLKVYYGSNQKDAADIGFDDQFIYDEIPLPYNERSIPFEQCERDIALKPFQLWSSKEDKTEY